MNFFDRAPCILKRAAESAILAFLIQRTHCFVLLFMFLVEMHCVLQQTDGDDTWTGAIVAGRIRRSV